MNVRCGARRKADICACQVIKPRARRGRSSFVETEKEQRGGSKEEKSKRNEEG